MNDEKMTQYVRCWRDYSTEIVSDRVEIKEQMTMESNHLESDIRDNSSDQNTDKLMKKGGAHVFLMSNSRFK